MDTGNNVVVIEHNLDVIAEADTIIDLGPEDGAGGGRVVAAGTPEEIAGARGSHTGEALASFLGRRREMSCATTWLQSPVSPVEARRMKALIEAGGKADV